MQLKSVPALALLAGMLHVAGAAGAPRHKQSDSDDAPTPAKKGGDGDNASESSTSTSAGTEFAVYTDTDNVTVITPSVNAGFHNIGGWSLSGNYLVDIVSAASADIVSTASSRWQEVRQAGTISGSYKPADFGVEAGGSVSDEPDYISWAAYAMVIKEFDQKNITTNFGYGFSYDTAGRCGGEGGPGPSCTPFSVFSRNIQRGSFNAGLGWVVDKDSLASVTLDLIVENGDQSKPYRYIPMFSSQVAPMVPAGASIAFVNANRLPERPLEQLPLSRDRYAATGRYARRLDASTLRLEERIYSDSWGLFASSTDGRWIFDLGRRVEFWPHVRFHTQSPVSFWQRAYVSASTFGWALPEYRTGDRELGPLWTTEGGLGLRWYLGSDADPRTVQLGLSSDAMYTSYLDDLYLTSRTGILGALTLQAEW
jgi:uncharacterized protein DUF3570